MSKIIKNLSMYNIMCYIEIKKQQKKSFKKTTYEFVKTFYKTKKKSLINRYVSNSYKLIFFFLNLHKTSYGLNEVFYKSFTVY